MDAKGQARALAGLRVAIGLVMLVAPSRFMRLWLGDEADRPGARALTRSFAARDLALGAGALHALRRGAPVRPWIEGGALSDAGDVLATLLGWRQLPPAGRALLLASSGPAAVLGHRVAVAVDAATPS